MVFSPQTGVEQTHKKLLAQSDFNFETNEIKKEHSLLPKNDNVLKNKNNF